MTGYPPAEAVSQRYDDLLFGPSTDAVAVSDYRRAREQGSELVQDLLLYRKDGATFWIESDLIPVRNATGQLTRWISIGNDITKRRQTEDALRAAKENAETNSRLKSEFLANLSHEIRTPMNAIMGMTELALATQLTRRTARVPADGPLVERTAAGTAQRYSRPVQDRSRQNGNGGDRFLAGRGGRRDGQDAGGQGAAERDSRWSRRCRPVCPPIVRGDPTRLRQILLNLLGNAIKFTEQGAVKVTVEEQWRSDEEISLHLAVRDTGMGIPAEQLDAVFEAFKQGDASTTRKYGGSGLGLTISSELVRMMKGRIWVDSTVGQGSTFHFTIRLKWSAAPAGLASAGIPDNTPRALPQPTADSGEALAASPAPRTLRILVADDHDANRSLATTVLTKRGHHCVEAASGHQVLEALARRTFDVVLMDVQMPGMDGYQTTAAIRKREDQEGGHVPIIALTAHAMSGDREKCLLAGMDAYLAKPLRPSELVQLVESVPASQTRPEAGDMSASDVGPHDPGYDLHAALESLDNDVDLLISQMSFFLNDGPALLEQIDQATQQRDARQLQLAAHRLKGMLARYAFQEAAELADALEQKGKQGAFDGAASLTRQLAPLVSRLVDGMREYVRQHQAL